MTKDQKRTISPREAARTFGTSRSTIMRALEAKKLKAFRDNRNAWQIDIQDLKDWLTTQKEPARSTCTNHQSEPLESQLNTAEIRTIKAEAERDAALLRAAIAEADRDHWRALAEKLVDQRRGWWPWKRT